ncbi:hypothetical protein EG328_005662 [Venturia inaequalis]|uniref:SH3 domain-containing protein n=1 Tax=Venturia inaequalis TaxID=5025 RepID=A0A8H3VES7_VENIN|nr:hypothetical protein EG328_005662 [Venturia inaequalis]
MAAQPVWHWDTVRNSYYCWSEVEQSYVLQDGTRIPAAGSSQTQYSPVNYTEPRTQGAAQDAAAALAQQQADGIGRFRSDSTSSGSGTGTYGLAQQFGSMGLSPAQAYHHIAQLQTEPRDQILDQELYKKGARARGRIKATSGKTERLDSNYRIQRGGKKFFRIGKVIKILWPELSGNSTEGQTVVSDVKYEEETFITKIRWFVVVKEGRESCTCVPISTYGSRGCGKTGLAKWQHCVVYTGKEPPQPLPEEAPRQGERSMLTPIQVKPKEKGSKMFLESRINFGKLYTVEHNVKVLDFGDVHKEHIALLRTQWKWVLKSDLKGNKEKDDSEEEEGNEDEDEGSTQLDTVEEGGEDEGGPDLQIHGTANWPWTTEGQLAFKKGDRILIVEYVDENWAKGYNLSTGAQGTFPRNYVQVDDSE